MRFTRISAAAAVLTALLGAGPAAAGGPLAKDRPETAAKATLAVASPAFKPGGEIPAKYSAYGPGVSPPLSWAAAPGAGSYALVMEDPDAHSATPFVHWVAWKIPGSVTRLPEGLPPQPRLTTPIAMLQGRNGTGSAGYFGPRPPAGDPPHHYHFQVFALDQMVDAPAGADRDQLLAAIKGHVVAKGDLVGTYQQR